jgi:putative thioredoxin
MRQDGVMQQPRDFSLYGAVDLGARQAAAQRSQQASRAGGPDDGPQGETVIDVTEDTFNVEVVERSRSVPVIIDLWAEWCGPCKQLSPVLEKLAAEAGGAWLLAKVDIDANPQLRAALQVQSIPMVMAVAGGQVVDGFLGAMPEAQVRQWLGQVMQVAGQFGVTPDGAGPDGDGLDNGDAESGSFETGGPAGDDAGSGGPGGMPGMRGGPGGAYADPAFEEAQQAMERGDLDGAAAAFERVLAAAPGHPVAAMGLAQVDLIRRVNSYDQAQVRRAAAENPDDVDAQAQVADIDLAMGRIEEGFDRLLGAIRRTSGAERDRARVHLISLFDVFPPGEPRVNKARATLSSLLF